MDVIRFEGLVRERFGTKYRKGRSKNGMEFKVCCPFCPGKGKGNDTNYKLWINPSINRWRCWRCNERGTVRKLLGTDAVIPEHNVQTVKKSRKVTAVMPGSSLLPMQDLDDDHLAVRYLRDRGFDPQAMGRCYGLYYCEYGREFANGLFDTSNTIIFPIWMGGEVVGWQARLLYNPETLNDNECQALGMQYDEEKGRYIRPPKYFTSPGLTKGDVLYNYDVAAQSDVVVAVEGPTDVLAAGPCAVGTLGKGISGRQTEMLKSWKLVVVMLDPGDADRETADLVHKLGATVPAVPVKLQGASDPGSATTREIWVQIKHQCLRHGYDISKFDLGRSWCRDIVKGT